MNILLGCTGSIGAKDTFALSKALSADHQVKVITTESAKSFFDLAGIREAFEVLDDQSDWKVWRRRGDQVLHIELRNWADLLLIAPLTANTLSKITHGICDNLLTTVFRAWVSARPILVAPSMNLHMWNHPLTGRQLALLAEWGVGVIEPRAKLLAGGDYGPAAQANIGAICEHVAAASIAPRYD
jgi:phosphopantothenoylcysteine decarboxylase